jgi:hypothetical protein
MISRAFLHSIIYTYTHTYTHDRIKVLTVIGRGTKQQALDIKPVATGIIKNSSPRMKIGGDEFFPNQVRLKDKSPGKSVPVRSWHCLVLEQKNKREWLVVCSDDAFPAPKWGWVCDCGHWTWGEDKDHTPIFSRVVDKVVAGRRKKSCRS